MKNVFKILPITRTLPEDYEKWLENYEANGWHLKNISLGGWIHHFIKGQPQKIRYCYDYQSKKRKDYETVFKDVGWELVYYRFGAYTWRIKYDCQRPDAFSDNSSIIERNRRLLDLLLICFIPLLLTIALTVICFYEGKSPGNFGVLFIIATFLLETSLIGRIIYTNYKIGKLGKISK